MKTNLTVKLIAGLLSLVMLLSLSGVAVFAEELSHELLHGDGNAFDDGTIIPFQPLECDHKTLHEESVDVGAFGGCDYVIYYETCECGEVKLLDLERSQPTCDLDETDESDPVIDENGNMTVEMRAKCLLCGIDVTAKAGMRREGCEASEFMYYTFAMGDEVIVGDLYYENSYTEHQSIEYQTLDLAEYGACGGVLEIEGCVACGDFTVVSLNLWSCPELSATYDQFVDADGASHVSRIEGCEKCGITRTIEEVGVNTSACGRYTTQTVKISIGDNVLFEDSENYEYDAHDYNTEYVFYGETCRDGVEVIEVCKNCDYVNERKVTWCGSNGTHYVDAIDLWEYVSPDGRRICGGTVHNEVCNVCNEVISVSADICCDLRIVSDTESRDENDVLLQTTTMAYCAECGFDYFWAVRYVQTEGCFADKYADIMISDGDTVLYEQTVFLGEIGFAHVFGEVVEMTEYSHVRMCEKCGSRNFEPHVYDGLGKVIQAPTCVENGLVEGRCTECDYVGIINIPANGTHTFDDGVRNDNGSITYTCVLCGVRCTEGVNVPTPPVEPPKPWCDHTNLYEEVLDLGALGACDGVIYYQTCECGEVKNIDAERFESSIGCVMGDAEMWENYIDENGNMHATIRGYCTVCKLQVDIVVEERYEGCVETESMVLTLTLNGEVIADRLSAEGRYENHRNTEFFEMDLSDYGVCGVLTHGEHCVECGTITYLYPEFYGCQIKEWYEDVTDENGVMYNNHRIECQDCGIEWIESRGEKAIASCQKMIYESSLLCIDGITIYSYEDEYSTEVHAYEYTYEMQGEVCSDGVIVQVHCPNCGYYGEDEYWECGYVGTESFRVKLDGYEYIDPKTGEYHRFCGGDLRGELCSLCGTAVYYLNGWLSCDLSRAVETDILDENGNYIGTKTVATCSGCGAQVTWSVYEERAAYCSIRRYVTVDIFFGDAYIYSVKADLGNVGESHRFDENYVCLDDNWHACYCADCGTSQLQSHNYVEIGRLDPLCNAEGWVDHQCIGCGFLSHNTIPASNKHTYGEGILNADGTYTYTCMHCGKSYVGGSTNCDHTNLYEVAIDLGALGACQGMIYYQTCECGEVKLLDLNRGYACVFDENCIDETNQYIDENGNMCIEARGHCSVCDLQMELNIKAYMNGCMDVIEATFTFTMNGEVVAENLFYGDAEELHTNTEYFEQDLTVYGACPGAMLYGDRCIDCGEIISMNPEFRKCRIEATSYDYEDENGVVHHVYIETCSRCGVEWRNDYCEVAITGCSGRVYNAYSLAMNGKVLCEYTEEYNTVNHSYEYRYELYGETCRDGGMIYAYCTTCGESYTRDFNRCGEAGVELRDVLDLHGMVSPITGKPYCGGYIGEEYCLLCGEISSVQAYLNCNFKTESEEPIYDEMGNKIGTAVTATCYRCGLQAYWKTWCVPTYDCYADKFVTFVILDNGETLYGIEELYWGEVWENHIFGPAIFLDEHTHIQNCERCGTAHFFEHNFVELGRKDPHCKEDGWRDLQCADCGHFTQEILWASGEHTWNEGVSSENGMVITYTCIYCGETYTEHATDPDLPIDPSIVYGDTNGDNAVNLLDLILLRRYLAEYDYAINYSPVAISAGADANGDGSINLRDVLLLGEYLANYSYDTGMSPVVLGPQGGSHDPEVEGSYGLSYDINADGTGYVVIGIGECTDSDIVIPDMYDGLPVVEIAARAFVNCTTIYSVRIGNNVTRIGTMAFSGCKTLMQVTLPDSLERIEGGAFRNCGLTDVVIPAGVSYIHYDSFLDCRELKGFTVDENNATYRSEGNCLIEIMTGTLVIGFADSVIPNDGSVTAIGDRAFYRCTNLVSIIIPDSVTRIGCDAFYNCRTLTTLVIPQGVMNIAYNAFFGCYKLANIYYGGTEDEWNAISIEAANDPLYAVAICFYSETVPTKEGNFWHYVDGEVVVWERDVYVPDYDFGDDDFNEDDFGNDEFDENLSYAPDFDGGDEYVAYYTVV